MTSGGAPGSRAQISYSFDGSLGNCVTGGSGNCLPISKSGVAKKVASLTFTVLTVNDVASGAFVVVFKP